MSLSSRHACGNDGEADDENDEESGGQEKKEESRDISRNFAGSQETGHKDVSCV